MRTAGNCYPELSQLAQRSLFQAKGPKKTHSKTLTPFFSGLGVTVFSFYEVSGLNPLLCPSLGFPMAGGGWIRQLLPSPLLRTQQHLGCSPRLALLRMRPPILLSPEQACCLSKLLSPCAAKWNKKYTHGKLQQHSHPGGWLPTLPHTALQALHMEKQLGKG